MKSELRGGDGVDGSDLHHIIAQGMNSLSFSELQKEQEELHGVSGEKTEKPTAIDGMLVTLQGQLQQIKAGTALEEAEMLNREYATPCYLAGFHFCYDDRAQAMMIGSAIVSLPSKTKAKMKVHHGSHLECLYRLKTFGISEHALPISVAKEEVILDNHLEWHKDRLQRENDARYAIGIVSIPSDKDVLSVGRKVNNGGNDRLLAIAAEHADWYNNGNSKDRRMLVDLIIEEIRKSGGRFLKPDDEDSNNDWNEVSVDEARSKIGQLFRNIKKRARTSTETSTGRKSPDPEHGRIVVNVSDEDVLFGRMYEHAGNERLRQQVELMAAEYNSSTRGRKKQIADSLVHNVKSRGGRFLKPIEGGRWVEVSDKAAETKVSARFRNFRKKTPGEDLSLSSLS